MEQSTFIEDLKNDIIDIITLLNQQKETSIIDKYNFKSIEDIYTNVEQKKVFIAQINSFLINEIIKSIENNETTEFCGLICLLNKIYCSQQFPIKIEMPLNLMEKINLQFYKISANLKKSSKEKNYNICSTAINNWNNLKTSDAIIIVFLPKSQYNLDINEIEKEIESISNLINDL